jgi:hypothetical protein
MDSCPWWRDSLPVGFLFPFPFRRACIESVWGTRKNHMEAASPRLSMNFLRHGQSISPMCQQQKHLSRPGKGEVFSRFPLCDREAVRFKTVTPNPSLPAISLPPFTCASTPALFREFSIYTRASQERDPKLSTAGVFACVRTERGDQRRRTLHCCRCSVGQCSTRPIHRARN